MAGGGASPVRQLRLLKWTESTWTGIVNSGRQHGPIQTNRKDTDNSDRYRLLEQTPQTFTGYSDGYTPLGREDYSDGHRLLGQLRRIQTSRMAGPGNEVQLRGRQAANI